MNRFYMSKYTIILMIIRYRTTKISALPLCGLRES